MRELSRRELLLLLGGGATAGAVAMLFPRLWKHESFAETVESIADVENRLSEYGVSFTRFTNEKRREISLLFPLQIGQITDSNVHSFSEFLQQLPKSADRGLNSQQLTEAAMAHITQSNLGYGLEFTNDIPEVDIGYLQKIAEQFPLYANVLSPWLRISPHSMEGYFTAGDMTEDKPMILLSWEAVNETDEHALTQVISTLHEFEHLFNYPASLPRLFELMPKQALTKYFSIYLSQTTELFEEFVIADPSSEVDKLLQFANSVVGYPTDQIGWDTKWMVREYLGYGDSDVGLESPALRLWENLMSEAGFSWIVINMYQNLYGTIESDHGSKVAENIAAIAAMRLLYQNRQMHTHRHRQLFDSMASRFYYNIYHSLMNFVPTSQYLQDGLESRVLGSFSTDKVSTKFVNAHWQVALARMQLHGVLGQMTDDFTIDDIERLFLQLRPAYD